MLKKLITIICHPSYIGLYLIDRISTAMLWVTFFFVFSTVLLATKDFSTKRLSHQTAIDISDVLLAKPELADTVFKDKKLTGTTKKIDEDGLTIVFNDSAYINKDRSTKLVLVFSHSEANAYFMGMNIGKFLYENSNIDDFSFAEIKNKDSNQNNTNLEVFVLGLLNKTDMNYRSIIFFADFFNFLFFYLVTFLVCYIASIIRNQAIDSRIRRKLVLYDTIIYFLFYWFELFFGFNWISGVGIAFALIYTFFTFSRIKKVEKKKEE